MEQGGRPFRGTTAVGAADLYDSGVTGYMGTLVGAKLVAAGAAASATLTDQDGTVLAEMSAPANGADWFDIPTLFSKKVRLNAIAGAGASLVAYVR